MTVTFQPELVFKRTSETNWYICIWKQAQEVIGLRTEKLLHLWGWYCEKEFLYKNSITEYEERWYLLNSLQQHPFQSDAEGRKLRQFDAFDLLWSQWKQECRHLKLKRKCLNWVDCLKTMKDYVKTMADCVETMRDCVKTIADCVEIMRDCVEQWKTVLKEWRTALKEWLTALKQWGIVLKQWGIV